MGTDSKRDAEKTLRVALILGAECGEDLRAQLSARGYSVLHARTAKEGFKALAEICNDETAVGAFSEENLQILFRNLTRLESRILEVLLQCAGVFVPKPELYRRIYDGQGPIQSRAIDSHIRDLKLKLGPVGKSIETRRGVGVRWNPEPCECFGLPARRLLALLAPFRAVLTVFLIAVGFAAGWLLRTGTCGPKRNEPGGRPGCAAEEIIPLIPLPEALVATEGMAVAPGHGPECITDGLTNTWFQTLGPARKRDLIQVLFRSKVRGRISVQCGVPGSTNRLPSIRIGVQYSDDEQRRLGFVDPGTGAFSFDAEKPVYKVFVAVDDDSDEPFAVQSVSVDP